MSRDNQRVTTNQRLLNAYSLAEIKVALDATPAADINAIGTFGRTKLYSCVSSCDIDMVNYLLSRGADPTINSRVDTLYEAAQKTGSQEMVNLIARALSCEVTPEHLKRAANWRLLNAYSLTEIKAALDATPAADINAIGTFGRTKLYSCVRCGDIDMVNYLLSRGADPTINSRVDTLYEAAQKTGNLEIVNLIAGALRCGFTDENQQRAANWRLLNAYSLVEIKAALDATPAADINAIGRFGRTKLYSCVRCGDIDMVNYLLNRGADPTISSRVGTLSVAAQQSGSQEMVNLIAATLHLGAAPVDTAGAGAGAGAGGAGAGSGAGLHNQHVIMNDGKLAPSNARSRSVPSAAGRGGMTSAGVFAARQREAVGRPVTHDGKPVIVDGKPLRSDQHDRLGVAPNGDYCDGSANPENCCIM